MARKNKTRQRRKIEKFITRQADAKSESEKRKSRGYERLYSQ